MENYPIKKKNHQNRTIINEAVTVFNFEIQICEIFTFQILKAFYMGTRTSRYVSYLPYTLMVGLIRSNEKVGHDLLSKKR